MEDPFQKKALVELKRDQEATARRADALGRAPRRHAAGNPTD